MDGTKSEAALFPRPDSELSQLSNAMVKLYKELFGRGPTRAKTSYADADTILCTLRESQTAAEQNMVRMGEHDRLRDMRTFFQHASEAEFVEVVERITGRKVDAFVSGIDAARDVASEIFYLEPVAS